MSLREQTEIGRRWPETAPKRVDSAAPPDPEFDCVFLSSSEREYQTASRLLKPPGIRIHHAALLEQADFLLTATGALVLLSDMAFLDGSWTDAKGMLAKLHPRVALVLALENADERLWLDVLEQGVYDVVLKPFAADELRRILGTREHMQNVTAAPPNSRSVRKVALDRLSAWSSPGSWAWKRPQGWAGANTCEFGNQARPAGRLWRCARTHGASGARFRPSPA